MTLLEKQKEALQSAISLLDLYREDGLVDKTIENVNGQNLEQVIEEIAQVLKEKTT